jgi:23S rRNA (adenine2503-C2)-methyltransferase
MPEPLLGMDLVELGSAIGPAEPAYRARQIYEAIYRRRIHELGQVHTLPSQLRQTLSQRFTIGLPEVATVYESVDGTRRFLLRLADARTIETVLMPEGERDTACISSQAGCPLDCRFCMTALLGFERNLTAGEIVGQVLVASAAVSGADIPVRGPDVHPVHLGAIWAKAGTAAPASDRRLNIVVMGQGEPLLNLANLIKATRLLMDPDGIGLSPRRITVSTAGMIPQMAELGRESVRPKLAVSLNASTEEMRREVMPITRKYPLKDLMEACRAYPLRPWEKLTFEYVMLKGVNDSDADARRVAKLLANINCKVNLIALNPGPEIPYETPAPDRVATFQSLVRRSVPCFIRKPRGLDIYAACGQLKRATA